MATSPDSHQSSHRATTPVRPAMTVPLNPRADEAAESRSRGRRPQALGAWALEIQAGGFLDALGGDGVHVALAQDDQVLAVHLDLVLVLRGEEHLVAHLDLPGVRPDAARLAPPQPLGDLRGGRYQDPAAGPAVAVLLAEGDQQAVVQHLD